MRDPPMSLPGTFYRRREWGWQVLVQSGTGTRYCRPAGWLLSRWLDLKQFLGFQVQSS